MSSHKKYRISGGGRKPSSQELEDELFHWYEIEYLQKKLAVSRSRMLLKAKEIYQNLKAQGEAEIDLKFSKGWLDNFLTRHNIVQRRTTTVCQQPPANYAEKLVSFVIYVSQKRQAIYYDMGMIYASDETAVWLDPSRATTLAPKGSRDVPVSNCGYGKLRVTVMLTAKANGFKCLPYVLLNRKRAIAEVIKHFQGKLVLNWAGKVWMTNGHTEDYLKKIIGPHLFYKRLLVWDSFRCHISQDTKAVLNRLKVDTAVVPGGCTKFVQPVDLSWNKPFKEKFQELHDQWLARGDLRLTRNGNLAPPPPEIYLKWIVDAWSSVSTQVILNSFLACGITTAPDGSNDDQIYAFKPTGPCPGAMDLLKQEREKIQSEVVLLEDEAENFYDSDQDSVNESLYDNSSEGETEY